MSSASQVIAGNTGGAAHPSPSTRDFARTTARPRPQQGIALFLGARAHRVRSGARHRAGHGPNTAPYPTGPHLRSLAFPSTAATFSPSPATSPCTSSPETVSSPCGAPRASARRRPCRLDAKQEHVNHREESNDKLAFPQARHEAREEPC